MHGYDVELPFTPPLWPDSLFGHLAVTGVPGVEQWRGGAYRRTVRLTHGPGVLALRPPRPGSSTVPARLLVSSRADHHEAVALSRRVLDLDADPAAAHAVLSQDPLLAPALLAAPGRRIPGSPDPAELAVRAVLGQQVSTAAARTHAGRLAAQTGEPVTDPEGDLSRLFPVPSAVVAAPETVLRLPASRRRALLGLAGALVDSRIGLEWGQDPATARAALLALPGIGPWTADTVLMRGLGDRDAFLPGDLGVRVQAQRLGLPADPRALAAYALTWRPYRADAVQYLWGAGDHAVNRLPGTDLS